MPELPEVETIRRQLTEILPFKINEFTKSNVCSSIVNLDQGQLSGKTITSVARKGKALIFKLDSNEWLISHLGMTGGWVIDCELPHTHLKLSSQNHTLSYVDPRRFGKMHLLSEADAGIYLKKLGIDVSTSEFTAQKLHQILKNHQVEIKPFLLEQKKISGIGNYMASEILAIAKINPMRETSSITLASCQEIIKATKRVIKGQVSSGGLTFQGGYRDTTGGRGDGLNKLVVFHQTICRLCKKSKIKKIVQKGRATFYCPSCQKR